MVRQCWSIGSTRVLWKMDSNLELSNSYGSSGEFQSKTQSYVQNVESTQTEAADVQYNWIYEENL